MLREQSVVYDPEDLSLFGDIFDRAVASLPAAMCTPFNRAVVARSICACVAAGERDPSQLELAALMNFASLTRASDCGDARGGALSPNT